MNYDKLLRQHQLKATPQRLAILDLIHRSGHISIEDMFVEIRHKFSSISLATLYKNVNTMLESSLLKEIKISGNKTKYELDKDRHSHILCSECGELYDIPLDPLMVLKESSHFSDYVIDDASIVINGTCKQCKSD